MAYSATDKAISFFRPYNHTGTGSSGTVTDVGFTPDMFWHKNRANNQGHGLIDSVRGNSNYISPNTTNAQLSDVGAYGITSGGFTFPNGDAFFNGSGNQIIFWSWLMGGTAPTKTYTVKVVSDGGNKYRFDDFGTSAVTLDLQEGGTYTFDASDSSVNSHPFVIGTAANGSEYSTGVTYQLDGVTKTYSQYTSGFSSATSRKLIITVAASAPALYYWCSVHSGMGGAINTNATHGSSDFKGSIQATVSANPTGAFSVVKWTGTNGSGTIGHGLDVAPKFIIIRRLAASSTVVYHERIGNQRRLVLDGTDTQSGTSASYFNNTSPTTTTFSVGSDGGSNGSTDGYVAYCFAEKSGYCKIGMYRGNGNADGAFTYTGFAPSLVVYKNISEADEWFVKDNKRPGHNPTDLMFWSADNAETSLDRMNLHSNGFKATTTDKGANKDGNEYVYLAIGQSVVGTNNIPATAR